MYPASLAEEAAQLEEALKASAKAMTKRPLADAEWKYNGTQAATASSTKAGGSVSTRGQLPTPDDTPPKRGVRSQHAVKEGNRAVSTPFYAGSMVSKTILQAGQASTPGSSNTGVKPGNTRASQDGNGGRREGKRSIIEALDEALKSQVGPQESTARTKRTSKRKVYVVVWGTVSEGFVTHRVWLLM